MEATVEGRSTDAAVGTRERISVAPSGAVERRVRANVAADVTDRRCGGNPGEDFRCVFGRGGKTSPGERRGRRHRARWAGAVFGRTPARGCGSVVVTGRRRCLRRAREPPSGGWRTRESVRRRQVPDRAAANRSQAGRVDRSVCFAAGGARLRVCGAGGGVGSGTPDRPGAGEHGTSPNVRTGIPVMRALVTVR
jgi:hypothetical protein